MSIRRFGAQKKMKDSDKYYPGSPWGDKPPEAVSTMAVPDPDQFVVTERAQEGFGHMMNFSGNANKHVDAYFEYKQLVGDTDGRDALPEWEYEKLREKALDPSRRVYVNWRNTKGLDCRAIGPHSMCFCGHRYRDHAWDEYADNGKLRCKMPGVPCDNFSFMPVRGTQDLKCSSCHKSFRDHHLGSKCCDGRKNGRGEFTSSWQCACGQSYDEHITVCEMADERIAQGRPVCAAWMQEAMKTIPMGHMGGVINMAALADGADREEFENQQKALAGPSQRALEAPPPPPAQRVQPKRRTQLNPERKRIVPSNSSTSRPDGITGARMATRSATTQSGTTRSERVPVDAPKSRFSRPEVSTGQRQAPVRNNSNTRAGDSRAGGDSGRAAAAKSRFSRPDVNPDATSEARPGVAGDAPAAAAAPARFRRPDIEPPRQFSGDTGYNQAPERREARPKLVPKWKLERERAQAAEAAARHHG